MRTPGTSSNESIADDSASLGLGNILFRKCTSIRVAELDDVHAFFPHSDLHVPLAAILAAQSEDGVQTRRPTRSVLKEAQVALHTKLLPSPPLDHNGLLPLRQPALNHDGQRGAGARHRCVDCSGHRHQRVLKHCKIKLLVPCCFENAYSAPTLPCPRSTMMGALRTWRVIHCAHRALILLCYQYPIWLSSRPAFIWQ